MNNTVFKNFSYSFFTNIIDVLIRSTYIFLLPKLIGVEDFGYWQLYFLYTQFMHFCHCGLVDGVYLKIGGVLYEEIKKKKLINQFSILVMLSIVYAILINLLGSIVDNENKKFIIFIISLDLIVMLPRTLLSIIFQATAQINKFSIAMLSEIIVSFCCVAFFIANDIKDFHVIILADLFGRVCSLCVSLFLLPEFQHIHLIKKEDFLRSIVYVKIGVFLLLANMAGMLIISIIRLSIEYRWGIVEFSKISLSFSISNMILVAINAASLALFPCLKRMTKEKLKISYIILKDALTFLLILILVFYYPIRKILEIWLPNYIDSFRYLGLLAPMCMYEAQMSLIYNNYLKSIRKERVIFTINIFIVIIAFAIAGLTIFFNMSLINLLLSVLGLGITKIYIANHIMNKYFSKNEYSSLLITILTTIIFIICNFYINGIFGMLIYMLYILIIYILLKNIYTKTIKDIKEIIQKYIT